MKRKQPKVYAVKHKSLEIRMASRSGGVFTAISNLILEEGGVIYGCVLTESFEAVHIRAEKALTRDRMRKSKYIQSNMGNIFSNVREDLWNDKRVLFSGTSCQIAGLKAYLGKEDEKLLCVDIVCHGVPSPRVLKEYIKWQEKRTGSKCTGFDFRNKRDFGWKAHVETLLIEDTKGKKKRIDSNIFTTIFYGHAILRPCCYQCPYKRIIHPGDITLADYWGIEKAVPGFSDDRGVSLVLLNNERGDAVFEHIVNSLEYRETRLEDSFQPALIASFEKPADRDSFWVEFMNKPFEIIAKKYGNAGWHSDLKRNLKQIKRRFTVW